MEAAPRNKQADPADRLVEEITSLCMNCHEDGTTKLLLTRIPFFREIVLMSFHCPHCNFSNSEIQSAGEIQQRGVRITFRVEAAADLQRQLVKSDTCVVRVESLDLEIPAGRGQLTNVEGLLTMVAQDLQVAQEEREKVDPELFRQIDSVIRRLTKMMGGEELGFTITLDDAAGNSSLEPNPADSRGKFKRVEYNRTSEDNAALGLATGEDEVEEAVVDKAAPDPYIRPEYHATNMTPALPISQADQTEASAALNNDDDEIVEGEVYSFPSTCPGCTHPCATHMKMVNIPFFKQVVIMSTVCISCGYRSNEVKSGGEVPDKGRRITLHIERAEDLSRDILKSESALLRCPKLQLVVEPGTMGGRFTTVEGLLTQVRDDLRSSIFDAEGEGGGDSMPAEDKNRWAEFFGGLEKAIRGEEKFTLVLEDPLASSYVQSLVNGEKDDPQIELEEYERTEEEEEMLGLRDMKTEGYDDEAAANAKISNDTR